MSLEGAWFQVDGLKSYCLITGQSDWEEKETADITVALKYELCTKVKKSNASHELLSGPRWM